MGLLFAEIHFVRLKQDQTRALTCFHILPRFHQDLTSLRIQWVCAPWVLNLSRTRLVVFIILIPLIADL